MELVMAELSDREDFTIFLFGGRGYEEALLDQWAFEYPRNEVRRYGTHPHNVRSPGEVV